MAPSGIDGIDKNKKKTATGNSGTTALQLL